MQPLRTGTERLDPIRNRLPLAPLLPGALSQLSVFMFSHFFSSFLDYPGHRPSPPLIALPAMQYILETRICQTPFLPPKRKPRVLVPVSSPGPPIPCRTKGTGHSLYSITVKRARDENHRVAHEGSSDFGRLSDSKQILKDGDWEPNDGKDDRLDAAPGRRYHSIPGKFRIVPGRVTLNSHLYSPYNPVMIWTTKKFGSALAVGLLAFSAFSCSHAPADVTEDIAYLKRVTSLIESIKEAYESRNLDDFLAKYPKATADEESRLRSSWTATQVSGLDFEIDRIFVAEDSARVFANWELSWVAVGNTHRSRGHVLFEIEGRESVRLTRVAFENPFLLPASTPPGGP